MLPFIPLVLNEGVEGEPQRMGFAPMIIMSGSHCRSPSTPSLFPPGWRARGMNGRDPRSITNCGSEGREQDVQVFIGQPERFAEDLARERTVV